MLRKVGLGALRGSWCAQQAQDQLLMEQPHSWRRVPSLQIAVAVLDRPQSSFGLFSLYSWFTQGETTVMMLVSTGLKMLGPRLAVVKITECPAPYAIACSPFFHAQPFPCTRATLGASCTRRTTTCFSTPSDSAAIFASLLMTRMAPLPSLPPDSITAQAPICMRRYQCHGSTCPFFCALPSLRLRRPPPMTYLRPPYPASTWGYSNRVMVHCKQVCWQSTRSPSQYLHARSAHFFGGPI